MEAHVFNNFFLRWDFTFQVTRAIKLPISARDWHVLVARFSKKQVYLTINEWGLVSYEDTKPHIRSRRVLSASAVYESRIQ